MYETTLNSVKELLGDKFEKCDSPSLRLTKLVRLPQKDKKEQGIKLEEIDSVCECAKKQKNANPIVPNNAEIIYGKLLSRLIVNQTGGILENAGLCLHRFFGYPMIPGSAVKGVASHAAWCEWTEASDEQKLEIAERIANVFGYPTNHDDLDKFLEIKGRKEKKCSGTVCFMDAVPQGTANLVVDVVTCHHPDYYSFKKDKATDDEQPIPNPFPAVEEGAVFKFTFVPLARCDKEKLMFAKNWLIDAFTKYGIGAKTRAGYGWFFDDTNHVTSMLIKKKEEEENSRKFANMDADLATMLHSKEQFTNEEIEKYNSFKQLVETLKGKDGYNERKSIIAQLEGRLPVASARDKLLKKGNNQFFSDCVKSFDKLKEEDKREVVLLLREKDGRGHQLWEDIKKNNKLNDAPIRTYCKNVMNLGKMP